jgi:hypothetical protein
MSTYNYLNSSLGFSFTVKMPFSNAEEYDRLAGQAGAAFDVLCAQTCYGSVNNKFGIALRDKLAAVSGLAVPTTGKKVKTKDGEVDELVKPKDYLAFIYAQKALTEAQVAAIVQEVANDLPVVEIGGSRGPAKPAKVFLDQALVTISGLQQAGKDIAGWVERVNGVYPGVPAVNEEDGYDQVFVARVLQHVANAQAAAAAAL